MIIKSKKRIWQEGIGTCKGHGCKYERKQVPYKKWVLGDGRYECPLCGYGVAPLSIEREATTCQ